MLVANPSYDPQKVFLNEEEDMEMNEEDLVFDPKVGSTMMWIRISSGSGGAGSDDPPCPGSVGRRAQASTTLAAGS